MNTSTRPQTQYCFRANFYPPSMRPLPAPVHQQVAPPAHSSHRSYSRSQSRSASKGREGLPLVIAAVSRLAKKGLALRPSPISKSGLVPGWGEVGGGHSLQRSSGDNLKHLGGYLETQSCSSTRKADTLPGEMETVHVRQLDPKDDRAWLLAALCGTAFIHAAAHRGSTSCSGGKACSTVDRGLVVTPSQGSNWGNAEVGGGGGIYSHYFLVVKKTGDFQRLSSSD